MNYLLDTHAFLWMLAEPARLSRAASAAIRDPAHVVFVSAVTSVELAIKRAPGKLQAPRSLLAEVAARGLHELPLRYGSSHRKRRTRPARGPSRPDARHRTRRCRPAA